MAKKPTLIPSAGIPVADNQYGLAVRSRGPGLLKARHRFMVPTMNPKLTPEQ